MTRRHPVSLDLTSSRKEKPAALRETGRDAFLPCKTPTSAGFLNKLKFLPGSLTREEYMATLDSNKYDEETKRNIAFLNSGSFYDEIPYGDHSHLAPPPPPSFAVCMDNPPLGDFDLTEESEDDQEKSAEETEEPMLVIDYMREYAATHGVWPKVSAFNDSFIPEELYHSKRECTGDGEQSGEDADGEAEDEDEEMEDISPLFTLVSLPITEEQDSSEIYLQAPQPEAILPPSATPAPSYDEIMSQSSEEDNDNSDDEDFQDPSYERLQHQLHHQFANSISTPELSSPSSSSSRSLSPYPITPKSSPTKRNTTTTTKAKPRACAKPYSTDPSARNRKSRSGSDNSSFSSPSPDSFEGSGDARYTTFRCNKTGKTMFQCRTCPEIQTKALGDMKRHLEGLKHQKPSHRCDPTRFDFGCGREFTRTDALKRHIKSKHHMGWVLYQFEMEEQERADGGRGARKGRK